MITETFSVACSIPLDDTGSRANATFTLGDDGVPLSQTQALAVKKLLMAAAAAGEVVLYASVVKTTVDDSFKP